MAIEPLQVIDIETGHDFKTTMTVFKKRDYPVWQLIHEFLNLMTERRRTHPDHEESPYKGSGEWGWHRYKNSLLIGVDVGCFCEHDCCGHLCRLSHEITLTEDYTIITTYRGFNY